MSAVGQHRDVEKGLQHYPTTRNMELHVWTRCNGVRGVNDHERTCVGGLLECSVLTGRIRSSKQAQSEEMASSTLTEYVELLCIIVIEEEY